MNKYIHYCWFGHKPLSRLAKKCLKSWQKYLPDYEIIRWDESNCNLQECPFVKDAYESEKWAFVSDYFRTKALNKYGGIYFDTDMLVTKNIDELLKNETFLGMESYGYANVAVWYEKKKNSYLSKELLKKYTSFKTFDLNKINDMTIPVLVTNILKKNGMDDSLDEIQHLKHDIILYPRDYFYPLSDDYQNNKFTQNTCMIHYFDASWIPRSEYIRFKVERRFGKKIGGGILNLLVKIKKIIRINR